MSTQNQEQQLNERVAANLSSIEEEIETSSRYFKPVHGHEEGEGEIEREREGELPGSTA